MAYTRQKLGDVDIVWVDGRPYVAEPDAVRDERERRASIRNAFWTGGLLGALTALIGY